MGLIYVISVILLLVIFMLIKKSNERLNAIGTLGLGIVLLLSYNIFECFILNFLRIKLTLLNLSVVNLLVIITSGIYLLKKREVQKYFIKLRDVIFIILLLVVIIVIANLQYGSLLEIKYEISDSAVHYRAAYNFAQVDNLLNLEHDDLFGLETWKIGSYVNSGLIMKIFSNVIDEFDYYKIFIIFGLFVLFMTGYIMYIVFIKFSKGKIPLIAFVVSLLFMLGYPLNSLLYGYEYMSIGILLVTSLLYAVQFYTNKEINTKQILPILFLLNFMLFHSYYQFVPYMYSALFIYICFINYKEDKKILTKKNIITLLITLIIPFILGFIYYFAQGIYNLEFIFGSLNEVLEKSVKTQSGIISSFDIEGYVYNNLYSNIILLLPLVVYVIIKEIRVKKTISFSSIAATFAIGYIILLIIGNHLGIVSDYYVTKNYFALWVILWYINFKGLYYLYESNRVVPHLLTGGYILILLISLFTFNVGDVENKLKNYKFTGFTEIYNVNEFLINDNLMTFYDKEIELMKYAKENLDKDKKIEILGIEYQILWAYPLLDYFYYYKEMDEEWFQHKLMYKYMNDEIIDNADYIICFYIRDFYRKYDKSKLENLEIVYENAFGKILKK